MDSGDKRSYCFRDLLDDEDEDSDNDDCNWKRKSSSSSSTPTEVKNNRVRSFFNDDLSSGRTVKPVNRCLDFEEEVIRQPIVRTINRTIVNDSSSKEPSPSKSSTEPIWKRLTFPSRSKSPKPSTSSQRVILTSIRPPTLSYSESEPSTSSTPRKQIIPPTTSKTSTVKKRLGPTSLETSNLKTPAQHRPPIPDTLDIKPTFAPPRPKYHSERNVDLDTFVKQIKAEMIFIHSLDRIYNRSILELSAMKAIPQFPTIIQKVIEGVLFDPEVQLNEETVHKMIKILEIFDMDTPTTWTFLIDQIYILISNNTDAHYVRMSKFIEMSFNHLFAKKTRFLPSTALHLYKLAQVRPFDPEKKKSARVKLDTIRADLSGYRNI